jgi:hypothetical protein
LFERLGLYAVIDFFVMVSKSMVVCFLLESEIGRSGFSARR